MSKARSPRGEDSMTMGMRAEVGADAPIPAKKLSPLFPRPVNIAVLHRMFPGAPVS